MLPAVIAEVLRKAPLSDDKVSLAWRLAVGQAIAKSTKVRLGSDGTLHVRADTPAWLAAVRKSTSLIHLRMGDLLGDGTVKKFSFGAE